MEERLNDLSVSASEIKFNDMMDIEDKVDFLFRYLIIQRNYYHEYEFMVTNENVLDESEKIFYSNFHNLNNLIDYIREYGAENYLNKSRWNQIVDANEDIVFRFVYEFTSNKKILKNFFMAYRERFNYSWGYISCHLYTPYLKKLWENYLDYRDSSKNLKFNYRGIDIFNYDKIQIFNYMSDTFDPAYYLSTTLYFDGVHIADMNMTSNKDLYQNKIKDFYNIDEAVNILIENFTSSKDALIYLFGKTMCIPYTMALEPQENPDDFEEFVEETYINTQVYYAEKKLLYDPKWIKYKETFFEKLCNKLIENTSGKFFNLVIKAIKNNNYSCFQYRLSLFNGFFEYFQNKIEGNLKVKSKLLKSLLEDKRC